MMSKALFILDLVLISYLVLISGSNVQTQGHNILNLNRYGSFLAAIDLPDQSFNVNALTSSTTSLTLSKTLQNNEESDQREAEDFLENEKYPKKVAKNLLKLPLRHITNSQQEREKLVIEYTLRDLNRINTFQRRITENNKNQKPVSRLQNHRQLLEEHPQESDLSMLPGHLVESLKSGLSLGIGEYVMDVFVGTPPKHFLLILDTGSDLNWIQCVPCYDCFDQLGPYYDPKDSSSFKNISCHDPRCDLVTSPDHPPQPCNGRDQSCPYFYWYGDYSNTTGDFAYETFTVNLTTPNGNSELKVENLMFGCGHWNRGLLQGAAGLLGLGRGPLSFSSQLKLLYGHSFSYCLVDRNSNLSVGSKLIFGEDKALLANPELNFTKLVNREDKPVDPFYYVQIKSIIVGGEALKIRKETWDFAQDGRGGTIIDSGTILSYFVEPAYEIIKEAFIKKINKYPLVSNFLVFELCYNVSRADENLEMPDFRIQFNDGAEWNFPVENYFMWVHQEVVCLAILGAKGWGFSTIGNHLQQNFHILYDTKKSRLGFAPTRCAEV